MNEDLLFSLVPSQVPAHCPLLMIHPLARRKFEVLVYARQDLEMESLSPSRLESWKQDW
jgi:hypothetical protein